MSASSGTPNQKRGNKQQEMTKQKHLFGWFLFLLLGIGIASCQSQPDFSLIKDSNCLAPCWSDITPGSTSGDEAMLILQEMDRVEHGTVERNVSPHYIFHDRIDWDFKNGSFGMISTVNDVVVEIRIEKINIPLKYLISHFGEPDHVMFLPYNGSQWIVNILYIQEGIWLGYRKGHIKGGEMINIQPNDVVESVTFISQDVYDELLADFSKLFRSQEALELDRIIQPWLGYREERIVTGH